MSGGGGGVCVLIIKQEQSPTWARELTLGCKVNKVGSEKKSNYLDGRQTENLF